MPMSIHVYLCLFKYTLNCLIVFYFIRQVASNRYQTVNEPLLIYFQIVIDLYEQWVLNRY